MRKGIGKSFMNLVKNKKVEMQAEPDYESNSSPDYSEDEANSDDSDAKAKARRKAAKNNNASNNQGLQRKKLLQDIKQQ